MASYRVILGDQDKHGVVIKFATFELPVYETGQTERIIM